MPDRPWLSPSVFDYFVFLYDQVRPKWSHSLNAGLIVLLAPTGVKFHRVKSNNCRVNLTLSNN